MNGCIVCYAARVKPQAEECAMLVLSAVVYHPILCQQTLCVPHARAIDEAVAQMGDALESSKTTDATTN